MNDLKLKCLKERSIFIDLVITKRCSMCCRSCMFGCHPEMTKKLDVLDYDIGTFEKDLNHLRSLNTKLEHIMIIGGEPFESPNIEIYLNIVRKIFPNVKLQISTNGIKLLRYDLSKLVKYNLELIITQYAKYKNLYPLILNRLKSFGIRSGFHEDDHSPILRDRFFKVLTSKTPNYDREKNHSTCKCDCVNLFNSQLRVCGVCQSIVSRNKYFDVNYSDDYINLYDIKTCDELIDYYFYHSSDLCSYCTIGSKCYQWIKWGKTYIPDIEDYII